MPGAKVFFMKKYERFVKILFPFCGNVRIKQDESLLEMEEEIHETFNTKTICSDFYNAYDRHNRYVLAAQFDFA